MFKQTLAASIALLGLNATAAAQTTGAELPPAQGCTLPKIADTAPLGQLQGTHLITVPVAINGATRQFLLDLSLKKPTQISPESMAELGLPESRKQTELLQYGMNAGAVMAYQGVQVPIYDVRDGLGAGTADTRVRVGSFTVGNATGHHLQFAVAKKGEIGPSAPYDGFLTGDFFRQYDVELDFGGKKMTWLTPTKCKDPDQVVFWPHSEVAIMPVALAKDGRLQMQAMVGGHVINAEMDTSSAHTVMRRDIAELYVGLKADKDMIPVGPRFPFGDRPLPGVWRLDLSTSP